MLGRWMRNVLVGVDQLVNAFAGGDPDETISSRAGKRADRCRLCMGLCWLLDKIDSRHCHKSIEADEGGRDIIFREGKP
jgi:hypothetical protein